MTTFIRHIKYGLYLIFFYFLKIILFVPNLLIKDKIYLFVERGFDAEDNAYFMYRYFKEKGKRCKYLITKNSKEIYRIDKEDVIYYGSLKHHLIIHLATAIISTHINTYLPVDCSKKSLFQPLGKKIFLQHGVIKNFHPTLTSKNCNLSMFVTSSKREYEDISSPKYGFKEGVVQNTGLARFDDLLPHIIDSDNTIKTVAIMPTWRQYVNVTNIEASDVLDKWSKVLNNQKLLDYCASNNIKLIFKPHRELLKYIEHFKNRVHSDYIQFGIPLDTTSHDLLVNSDLLITDYSSVFFDYGYMKKPVIHYQFDEEEFYAKHYPKGYFDYDIDGFGPVCRNEDDLIQSIIDACENKLDPKYRKREEEFFERRDSHNRERIYNAIEKIVQAK